jgi:hypothetical protein
VIVVVLYPPELVVLNVRPPPGLDIVKISEYFKITTPDPPVPPI